LVFQGAHQLKVLFIVNSYESSFPPGLFHDLKDLEWLTLQKSGNAESSNLSDIDFTGLENVKMLRIKFEISNLTGNWCHTLKNLRYLALVRNGIQTIDSMTFSQMQNLILLQLYGNRINQLNASTFGGLTNLRSLDLQKDHISHIEHGTFLPLHRLKKLDLSYNKLTALDEYTLSGLDNLQYLSLKGNLISNINVNTFSALARLVQLDLSKQDGLVTIDLNAFPQFIDLQTRSVVYTAISSELDAFELQELQWFKGITSYSGYFTEAIVKKMHSTIFGQFPLNNNQDHQIDLHNLTHNVQEQSLIFGNLDLSNNDIVSVNVN